MSKEKFENPVAVATLKIEGVFFEAGEEVPADGVNPERLKRLEAKGRITYDPEVIAKLGGVPVDVVNAATGGVQE